MKLIIESDGTLQGTTVEFKLCAEEIPQMIERAREQKMPKRVRHTVERGTGRIVPITCYEYGEN